MFLPLIWFGWLVGSNVDPHRVFTSEAYETISSAAVRTYAGLHSALVMEPLYSKGVTPEERTIISREEKVRGKRNKTE